MKSERSKVYITNVLWVITNVVKMKATKSTVLLLALNKPVNKLRKKKKIVSP